MLVFDFVVLSYWNVSDTANRQTL